jgi:hypothetical protein
MTTTPQDDKMLGVYLNDHLAGATAGVELVKRLAGENRDRSGGQALARLAQEIADDRDALLDVLAALDIPVRHYKAWMGWVGEKFGRLKPNGRLFTRSPLSQVIELEMLGLGIEGKASGWRTLRTRAAQDARLDEDRFDGLLDRAHRQAETVERLRVLAAVAAFGGVADPSVTAHGAEGDHGSKG